MFILLSILLVSLVGIVVIVGRKMMLIRKGELNENEIVVGNPFHPDIEKLKYSTIKNVKRYGYLSLFTILRLYIHTANIIKKKSLEFARRIENRLLRSKNDFEKNSDQNEVNKHLKMISEYLSKIRRMKKRIKEEEGVD